MTQNWKRWALVGIAAVAIIVGVVVAIVSSTGHSHKHEAPASARASERRGGDLAVAASYLGLTRTQLRHDLRTHHTLGQVAEATSGRSATGLVTALVSAKATRLEASVENGKLTEAKEKARVANLRARATASVERPYSAAKGSGQLAVAASYLGVSTGQLRKAQQSGRSLAQLANARSGKSAAGLVDAIVTRRKAKLAIAAKSGSLSPEREKTQLAALRRRVTAEVNRAPGAGRVS